MLTPRNLKDRRNEKRHTNRGSVAALPQNEHSSWITTHVPVSKLATKYGHEEAHSLDDPFKRTEFGSTAIFARHPWRIVISAILRLVSRCMPQERKITCR